MHIKKVVSKKFTFMRNWEVWWFIIVVFICPSLINGVQKILLECFLHAMLRKVLFQKKDVMHVKQWF